MTYRDIMPRHSWCVESVHPVLGYERLITPYVIILINFESITKAQTLRWLVKIDKVFDNEVCVILSYPEFGRSLRRIIFQLAVFQGWIFATNFKVSHFF